MHTPFLPFVTELDNKSTAFLHLSFPSLAATREEAMNQSRRFTPRVRHGCKSQRDLRVKLCLLKANSWLITARSCTQCLSPRWTAGRADVGAVATLPEMKQTALPISTGNIPCLNTDQKASSTKLDTVPMTAFHAKSLIDHRSHLQAKINNNKNLQSCSHSPCCHCLYGPTFFTIQIFFPAFERYGKLNAVNDGSIGGDYSWGQRFALQPALAEREMYNEVWFEETTNPVSFFFF